MSEFYEELDRKEQENRIKRIFSNRPDNLHDYQGCINDPKMQKIEPQPAPKASAKAKPADVAQPEEAGS